MIQSDKPSKKWYVHTYDSETLITNQGNIILPVVRKEISLKRGQPQANMKYKSK